MEIPHILEALMLVSFGASWPAQIVKTVRVKNPLGKSFVFQYLIIAGYVCGILCKVVQGQGTHWLVWIYLLNIALVLVDLILSKIYLARIRRAEKQKG